MKQRNKHRKAAAQKAEGPPRARTLVLQYPCEVRERPERRRVRVPEAVGVLLDNLGEERLSLVELP